MKLLLTGFCIYCASNINAQVTQQWVDAFNRGGTSMSTDCSIGIDAGSNVYLAGRIVKISSWFSDDDYACIIKYDSSGNQKWINYYNEDISTCGAGDGFNSIAVDAFGNSYVTGVGSGCANNGGVSTCVTVKYNAAGVQQWVKDKVVGTESSMGRNIKLDQNGNVYVVGTIDSSTASFILIIKYDTAGVEKWTTTYRPSGFNATAIGIGSKHQIDIDPNGNIYVISASDGITFPSSLYYDILTLKLNANGVIKWAKTNGTAGNVDDKPTGIAVKNGGVYISAYTTGATTYQDYTVIKYDTLGNQQWIKQIDGGLNSVDMATDIMVNSLNQIIVTGYLINSSGQTYFTTIKYDNAGSQQWLSKYTGHMGTAFNMALDINNNIYVTGDTSSNGGPTKYDMATVSYDNNGNQRWVIGYSTVYPDLPAQVAVENTGSCLYVVGTGNSTEDSTYVLIKYCQQSTTGILNEEIHNTDINIFPNPFNTSFVIKINSADLKNQSLELIMYDLLGSEIKRQQLIAGEKEYIIERGNLSEGMYFYKLTNNNEIIGTGKLVVSE